jgi:hypothetical protein
MDASGHEVRSFGVDIRTVGGRLDSLANGHIVIPEKDKDRVAEYDADGRVVWEARVSQPIAAVRLPTGNTLVTSMTENGAIELDARGKVFWQYKSSQRVNRAFRR